MDFVKGELTLYKHACDTQGDEEEVVAKGEMTMLPLIIYSVDVIFGSRGAVRMLVNIQELPLPF